MIDDPFNLNEDTPIGTLAAADNGSLPNDNEVSPSSMPTDAESRGRLLDGDEALIDMMTQQMDAEILEETQRAEDVKRLNTVADMVQVDLISRDDVLQCESYCPGISASVGGPAAFSIHPSRNGLAELRRAVQLRLSEVVNGTLATEDGTESETKPMLFAHLDEVVAKVNESTAMLNQECRVFPVDALEGHDRVIVGYQGFWLADVNLETTDIHQFAEPTHTPTDKVAKAVETIVMDYLSPKRADIRAEIGLTGPITIRTLYDVVVNRTHLAYVSDLHGQLETLYTRIQPVIEHYMAAPVLERDPVILSTITSDVREYCRIAKVYNRLCKQNVVFESAVEELLAWRRQAVAMM